MNIYRRQLISMLPGAAAAACLGPALSTLACADEPVRLVIPFPAGGVTDAVGRKVADGLRELWGTMVLVENRGGGSGIVAANAVKGVPADGRTLFFGYAGTHAANASLFKNLPYNPVADFTPIGMIADTALLILASASAPYKDLAGLIAYAKANPGKLSFATTGIGSPSHLALEWLKAREGLSITSVPYTSSLAQLVPDLISGRTDGYFAAPLGVTQHMKTGKLRALALTADARLPGLEEVPTTAEAGLPGFLYSSWFGLLAAGKIPAAKAKAEAMSKDLQTVIRSAAFRQWCQERFMRPLPTTGAEFASFMAKETEFLRQIIVTAKVTLD
ncbi:Bug family tripartite tricarboxylate transporter substrate binding protein [Variovorax terrae]|uniref:Tripartite tricarboxylate transporter substrate binding protein n=1 Tax=Variovorax terrae TaxID=2923278 RepID=A0A9X2AM61_9BURK|nr:tripartite tricarboxylate transporter substrate binding protein [Variovorax terrae]MCJ0763368.1 tripartite tricarboxylate transporter substrate binding protein [Variovorax terrae]